MNEKKMEPPTDFYAKLRSPDVVWAAVLVARERGQYVALPIAATLNKQRDILKSVEVDGYSREWHRRGAPVFPNRSECIAYIKTQGWPLP